jgi:MFS transporter, DHA1 family, inner membrane transport protein
MLKMTNTKTPREIGGSRAVAATLFLCLFAAQAGAITLSPVLVQVARHLDVSTATAGQLRTVAGLFAAATALGLNSLGRRVGLRRQLLCGSTLLALGSLASAAAPGIGLLAAAQVPVGAGIGILTTGGALAAAEWVPAERRAATLSWTLVGQPAAWIVGMPLVGAAAEHGWRTAWIIFPLVAALLAAAAVAARRNAPSPRRPPASLRAALATPGVGRWLVAEALTNTGWAGTLVYSGALFVQSYDLASVETGVVLAFGAVAYVCGNIAARRLASLEARPLLVTFAVALAMATGLFGAVRASLAVSAAFFAAAALAAGGRTLVSNAFGLSLPVELRPGAMAMRAASMQFGYFTGSTAACATLAVGGYAAFGATMGALFLSAALVLARPPRHGREFTASAAIRFRIAVNRARA